MKRVLEPVEVRTRRNRPHLIRRGRQLIDVRQVLDWWVVQSRWWAHEERRIYFLVVTSTGTLELYRQGDAWVLTRVFD